MQPGTRVRVKAEPSRIGVVTTRVREVAGRRSLQVQFPDALAFIHEAQLEQLVDAHEDPLELVSQGKFGRVRDLRGTLTHVRLSGRLADVIYSMNTTNTEFLPYQFKPVLNFLESPSNGLLIADEVGLGKTIEAGLIWTELRSRFDARRLLVLCPAMLRGKWKAELRNRFGIDADIVDAGEILTRLREIRGGERKQAHLIASMQGLRPRRGWEEGEASGVASVQLAKYLEDVRYEDPLLDLVVIDEAHYLRNPESMTARLGWLFRRVTEHIVLLSATPIHLRNQDLYQLLTLVDEDTFNRPDVFDEILEANEPVLAARDRILSSVLSQEQFVEIIEQARVHRFMQGNRQLDALLNPLGVTNGLAARPPPNSQRNAQNHVLLLLAEC
jgi:hypothetical protein